jgi:hypothetical protein
MLHVGLAIAAAGLVFLWLTRYNTSDFNGGQGIVDSGTFSYPRYHAQIGTVPLSRAGENRFTVKGLPPGRLALKLEIMGKSIPSRDQLSSLSTNVQVVVIDGSEHELCNASGRLSNASTRGEGGWALAGAVPPMYFWNSQCLDIPIKRTSPYTVSISVSEIDPTFPDISAVVKLDGGGIELP